jgi:SAM-dependent methyltransferase
VLTVAFDVLGLRAGERALDLGCGGGRHAFELLRRGGAVVAFDRDGAGLKDAAAVLTAMTTTAIDGEQAEVPHGHWLAVQGDGVRLPFADAGFDRVVVSEVLEHVADDRGALAEVARVVRPGGTIACTVPRWFPEHVCWLLSQDYHDTPGGHIRIYRRANLEQKLRDVGLDVVGHHHAHGLHSAYWWLRCLDGVRKHPEHEAGRAVRAYHRLLVKDIVEGPRSTRTADRVLTPIMGKSLVVYARKPGPDPEDAA